MRNGRLFRNGRIGSTTSSDENEGKETVKLELNYWLAILQRDLGVVEDLMETYFSRDEAYYTRLASEGAEASIENTPDELQQENRRIVLSLLIHCFRPLKKILLELEPEMSMAPLDLLVDELWEIERGGQNRFLIRPAAQGRGSRPSLSKSLHRAPLVVAYDRLIDEGYAKQDAIKLLEEHTGLKSATIGSTVKDFHEGAKDADSLQLYKILSKESGSAAKFIHLYMQRIVNQWG